MQKAIELAKKGQGKTSPNPLVGAVIVKDNKVIAKGFHKRCGLAHAEVVALKKAGAKAKGATLYVNLEPCFHFGRTPPCVDKVVESGIKRVVIAVKDPNPQVKGKSINKLRRNKIKVSLGICKKEAKAVNEVFFKNIKDKFPFVAAKVAQSLDGKITTSLGQSKWITTDKSRYLARKLRDNYDAILVGAETLRKDNPKLNGVEKIPYKIIVSSSLDLPKNSYLFKNFADSTFIFTLKGPKVKDKLPDKIKVFQIKANKREVSLKKMLRKLYQLGVMSVFVEGGSDTLGRFFDQGLVDKAYFFIAPKVFGGKNSLTSIGAGGVKQIKKSHRLINLKIRKIGADILVWGNLKR